jgi:hypothetical protein
MRDDHAAMRERSAREHVPRARLDNVLDRGSGHSPDPSRVLIGAAFGGGVAVVIPAFPGKGIDRCQAKPRIAPGLCLR